jgi:hypothetical protein
MKVRTTIILLVVLALLAGYVYLSGRGEDATTAPGDGAAESTPIPTPVRVPVLELDPATIAALEVRSPAGAQVRLSKAANTWELEEPQESPADMFQVTQAITDLAQLTATRVFTPVEDDLTPYGLTDSMAYEVELLDDDDDVLALLRLGAPAPTGAQIYVQHDDAPAVYLVNDFAVGSVQTWLQEPPLAAPAIATPARSVP